ncbi:MAG: lipid-A-disaccharide synthase [Acidobacteria bacterium]|nr:lipid-A-disaccharide synthase [Acidobacteriota bacterium]
MSKRDYRAMIVAGEPSGDKHAASLVKALEQAAPDAAFQFFGSAGPAMRQAGVEPVVNADDLAIVGVPEIARALPMFLKAFGDLKKAATERKPDVAVLVDFPDFNLRLAKALKKKGFKVVYYISPQLWAWRRYRAETIRKYVDLLLTILPFEADWYAKRDINHVEFVGNPLAAEVSPKRSREEFRSAYEFDNEKPLIALLPGSRHKEISKILPELLAAASLIEKQLPEAQFVAAFADERRREELSAAEKIVRKKGIEMPKRLTAVFGETYDTLNAADAAAVTSGTATLETAIIGTPMVMVYKGSDLNYLLLRPLINVEHFCLVNLIAGERVVKELVQHDLTPTAVSTEILRLLRPDTNAEMRQRLAKVREKLGPGGASQRAAGAILGLIG